MTATKDIRIGVLGLGYVGMPLAIEFSKCFSVVGFDIDPARVGSLRSGFDATREVSREELASANQLQITDRLSDLQLCNVFIVTVPTPIDEYKRPNLKPLIEASKSVGSVLKSGDFVVYESTVYPGATEEDCVPILEQVSGLKLNLDFYVGYSPERINPGDKNHKLPSIVKVTSGSTEEAAEFVDYIYNKIITAGTYKASSIKVAEAAKVIENTQRDVNIALINELAIIFNKMDIDTEAVLDAAATKWNFLPFRPGLVGGHCIGVDPYYLTHKAESIGYRPEVILSGRRLNDSMGQYVVSNLIKSMAKKHIPIGGSKILVLGLAFKENCPDIRNSKVVDIVSELQEYGSDVAIFDPWVDRKEVTREVSDCLIDELLEDTFDAIVIAVAHSVFKDLGHNKIQNLCRSNSNSVIYDLKCILAEGQSDLRL